MTIEKYINPEFDRIKQLIFLGLAFAGLLIISLIIMFGARMSVCLVDRARGMRSLKDAL